MYVEEDEVNFIPLHHLQLNYFEETYILCEYFIFPPPNYIVGRYVKYICYVKIK
jgi:hypothetical protein